MSTRHLVTIRSGELFEREIEARPEQLPAETLSKAVADFLDIARGMQPDDLSVTVDAAAGKLHFRSFRRPVPASSQGTDDAPGRLTASVPPRLLTKE